MSVAHVGATVAAISRESVAEVFTVLEGLEVVATRTAAERATPTDLDHLTAIVHEMDRALDEDAPARWAELNPISSRHQRLRAHAAARDDAPCLRPLGSRAPHYFNGVLVRRARTARPSTTICSNRCARRSHRAGTDGAAAQSGRAGGIHDVSRLAASGRRRRAPRVSEARYPRVAAMRTPDAFERHLASAGIRLGFDRELATPAASPLAQPFEIDGVRVGNRFCVLPMEGWDGTPDGEPSDLTIRRWQNFGRSGAKLIWGGEAVAVRHDGRANRIN